MNDFTDKETYCIAKIVQSALFSEEITGEQNLFHGCKNCKYQKECVPGNVPHSNMIFDTVRRKLQAFTGVNLDCFLSDNKFEDITNTECVEQN